MLSLGCAFSLYDLFVRLNVSKFKTPRKELLKLDRVADKKRIAARVFVVMFQKVLSDLIEENIIFHLPVIKPKIGYFHVNRIRGESFAKLKKEGRYKDVDFLKTNFSTYRLNFTFYKSQTPRSYTIYVNKKLTNRIIEKANQGFQYGGSAKDRYLKDYIEYIQSEFPTLALSDIKLILKHGWRYIYQYMAQGGYVSIQTYKVSAYIGSLFKDPFKHFNMYLKKLYSRLRTLYTAKKIPPDPYHYFAVSEDEHLRYQRALSQKTEYNFGLIRLFSREVYCLLNYPKSEYIYRIYYPDVTADSFYAKQFTTDQAELYIKKSPLTFKEVLTFNKKYKV